MQEKCRLCGEEKISNELFDFKSEIVQSVLQKCSIFIDENKLLPQNCCSTCFEVLENFSKFLDNINSVQDKLNDELNKHLADVSVKQENTNDLDSPETVSIFFPAQCSSFQIKTEDNCNDSETDEDRIELIKLKKSKTKKYKRILHHPAEKVATRSITKSWKKYSMAEIFERELKEGSLVNKSLAHLDVTEEDINDDGSLTASGIEKFGVCKWSDIRWYCGFCSASYNNWKSLTEHFRNTHNSEFKYKCSTCTKTFVICSAYYNHIIEHNPSLKFCCQFCSTFFYDLVKLYYHQEEVHGTSSHFCLYCGSMSKTTGKLKDHVVWHLKPEEFREKFICDICGKIFRTKKFVRAHVNLHLYNRKSTKDFICDKCGASFKQLKCLYAHRSVHQETRPFQCEFCEKNFKSKRDLVRHSFVIHPDKNHQYKNLKKTFTKQKYKPPRKYICDICNQGFASEKIMMDHKNIHTGNKIHECDICRKRFCTQTLLTLHRRRHTNEKNHRCLNCDSTFKVKSDLNRHIKRVHHQ